MAKKNVNIASSTEVKKYNYSQVYRTIYQETQISKQDLATKLQLSLPTVSQNLLELEKVGLIEKAGYYSSTGGRKPSIIQAVRTARVAAGLEIIREMAHLVVVDLYGSLLLENRLHLPFCKSEEYFDTLCQWVENQLHTLQVDQSHLLGIGISIQGLVAPDGISIVFSPLQEGVMLTDFSARLSYPCVMIHDVEAAAAAEIWYQPDLKDAVYISLNRNMGGALIVNGAVHTGSHYSSATVEHMCIHPKGRKCYCGKQGCLEVYCSALTLQQNADENAEQFFFNLRLGRQKETSIWEEYLRNLALAIDNIRMVIRSDILIGGYLQSYMTPEDIEKIKQYVHEQTFFKVDDLHIKSSLCGEKATAIGCALHYIKQFLQSV